MQGDSDGIVDKAPTEEADAEQKTLSFRSRRRKGNKRRRSCTRPEETGDARNDMEEKEAQEMQDVDQGEDLDQEADQEEELKVEEPPAPRITRNRLQQQQQQVPSVEQPHSPRATSQVGVCYRVNACDVTRVGM